MKFETLELVQKKQKYQPIILNKNEDGFYFDNTRNDGCDDNSLKTIAFDINLITWEGERGEYDLYYVGAEDDFDEGAFHKKCIGSIEGQFINVDRLSNMNMHIFVLFDNCADIDGRALYEDVFDDDYIKDEIFDLLSGDAPIAFFHISTIYLKKQYRNKGYGTAILQNIDKMLYFGADFNISFITLHCNPLDNNKHDKDEEIERLSKFYQRCGFQPIGDDICMIKILDNFIEEGDE